MENLKAKYILDYYDNGIFRGLFMEDRLGNVKVLASGDIFKKYDRLRNVGFKFVYYNPKRISEEEALVWTI